MFLDYFLSLRKEVHCLI